MPDLPMFQDLFNIARDEALFRNGQLTLDAINRDGSDANIMIAAASAAADEVVTQLANALAALYLDSAQGENLDKLVFDRYQILRNPAAPAVGQVQLTTATSNPASFSIIQGTQFGTSNGITFISTDPVVIFAAGSTGPITVNVESLLAGSSQQATIGTITSILTQIPGAPANLSVTNAAATAGAADEETDDSLRNRARLFFTTVQRGTMQALVQGALAVPGVVSAEGFESIDQTGVPSGTVELLIADQYTDALALLSTVPPSYQTQSQALAAAVSTALFNVRAAGVNVIVTVAQVVLQPIQLALAFPAGADTVTVASLVQAAVVSYTNSLPPGSIWSYAAAEAAIQGVNGLMFTGNEIVSPVGNVIPTPLQAIRTTLALVTTFVPQ
jgi:hypothetical protein